MDKNFNENELSDIMKEIEALEKNLEVEDVEPIEVRHADKPEVAESSKEEEFFKNEDSQVFSPEAEVQAEAIEENDEVAEEEYEQEQEAKHFSKPVEAPQRVVPFQSKREDFSSTSRDVSPTSMSFKVSGSMQLELHFEVNGKSVELQINESGLVIGLDGGASFNVPLKKSA